MRRPVRFASFAFASIALARPSFGEPPGSVDLEWDAPADCPGRASVIGEVDRILSAAATRSAHMRVEAKASRPAQDKWHVDLVLHGPDWEAKRGLDGPTCPAVTEAAALVIALAMNAEIESPEAPAREPPTEPPRETRVSFQGPAINVAATGITGAVPGATVGGEGNVDWTVGHVRFEVGGSYFAPRRGTLATRNDVGATFRLGAMNARGCYLFEASRATFGPCADVGVAWTRAQGFGPIAAYEASSTTPTLGGALFAEWQIARLFAPFVRIGGATPTSRPEYSIEGMGRVHRAPPFILRGAVGVEMHFD